MEKEMRKTADIPNAMTKETYHQKSIDGYIEYQIVETSNVETYIRGFV
jgi:hypothetical protein